MAPSKSKAADDTEAEEEYANPAHAPYAADLIASGESEAPEGYAPEDRKVTPEPVEPQTPTTVPRPGGAAERSPDVASVAEQAAQSGNTAPPAADTAGTSPGGSDATADATAADASRSPKPSK